MLCRTLFVFLHCVAGNVFYQYVLNDLPCFVFSKKKDLPNTYHSRRSEIGTCSQSYLSKMVVISKNHNLTGLHIPTLYCTFACDIVGVLKIHLQRTLPAKP